MYPTGELTHLAARKAVLQARIAVRRWECVASGVVLARPIATFDGMLDVWRRVSPWVKLAGVPAILLALRAAGKRAGTGRLAKIAAALPLVLRTWRMIHQARAKT